MHFVHRLFIKQLNLSRVVRGVKKQVEVGILTYINAFIIGGNGFKIFSFTPNLITCMQYVKMFINHS